MFVHFFSLNPPVIIFKSLKIKLVSVYISGKEFCPNHGKKDQQGLAEAGITFDSNVA